MPPPQAHLCDLCGQKFFKRSLPIHRKQCEKKYQTCFTECKKCLRKVSNDEFEKHTSECKVVRRKAVPKPKMQSERPIKQATLKKNDKENHSNESSEESSSEEEDDYREECGFCHRKFNPDRIAKHESICHANASRKKRSTFKSAAQARLEGTDFEAYIDTSKRREVAKLSPKWRHDHERLQGIIEQGRLVKVFKEAGVPLTELPRPGTDLKKLVNGVEAKPEAAATKAVPEGMERCPHCTRTFSIQSAAKHIPKCKTTINKPKTLVRKSKVVLEKPKQDNSGVISSLIARVLKMTTRKNEYYETKEASMFRTGDEVVTQDGRKGTVRYIGRVDELFPGYWLGIELQEPQGNNNGSVEQGSYFKCAEQHGVFLRPSKVKKPLPVLAKPATPETKDSEEEKPLATEVKPSAKERKKDSEKKGTSAGPQEAQSAPVEKKSNNNEPKSATDDTSPQPKKGPARSKEGMVDRLRKEVRANSPRVQEKAKDTTARTKPSKKSAAELAKQKRLQKDVKFLEALHGAPTTQPPREEDPSTFRLADAGSGQKLGGSSNPPKSKTGAPNNGPARPDRAARAAYFEKMFAQKQQQ